MGKITDSVCNNKITYYIYDDFGGKTQELNLENYIGYFYEGNSQAISQTITGVNNLVVYSATQNEYDDEIRLIKVKENSKNVASYTYDANGNKATETLANGVTSNYSYNLNNKITNISNKKGNIILSEYSYTYYLDGSDACKIRNESGSIETTQYEYDGLKRLISESETIGTTNNTYTYQYDDYGNRSKMTATGEENYTTSYIYNDTQGNYTGLLQRELKTSALTPGSIASPIQQTVYTYDANGNQITKTDYENKIETNSYDTLNQLISFTDGTNTASYTYNINGLRATKTVNGVTTKHIWNGQQLIADVSGDMYVAKTYIRGTGLLQTFTFNYGERENRQYYLQNAHGDVVNLLNTDGAVTKTYHYDAFGVEKNIDSNDDNAFRYCGEYFDKETGTIYLRARYYNPSSGRFIQKDSNTGNINQPLSLNLYTYCQGNPIAYVDANGHERIVVSGGLDGNENFRYNFIETAIKQIGDWQANDVFQGDFNIPNDITWMVANWNYTEKEIKKFAMTANKCGVNFMAINDKQELFDYINKNDRSKDPIEAMSFFAHGTAFDVTGTVPNPGHKGDYALALGYSAVNGISHNNNLNIFSSDTNKINKSSFSKKNYTYFGSCRAGNLFNGTSFAQQWANVIGGSAKAATGNGADSGRTDYNNIYPSPIKGLDSLSTLLGRSRTERQDARWAYGYSTTGCKNYPTITDGGEWRMFTSN